METKNYNRCSYKELLKAATGQNAEQIDIDTLGEWFWHYGQDYWNGEHYDADGDRLFPVYDWDEENEQGELVRYEFR